MESIYWTTRTKLLEDGLVGEAREVRKYPASTSDQGAAKSPGRLVLATLQVVESRLRAFDLALTSFYWPGEDTVLGRARLIIGGPSSQHGTTNTSDLEGDVYKYFSSGLVSGQFATLKGGEYKLSLNLGSETESFKVALEDGMTNTELVAAVAKAVNTFSSSVRAEHIVQTRYGEEVEGLNKIGDILALSVDPADAGKTLDLTGTSTLLKTCLGLSPNTSVTASAPERTAPQGLTSVYTASSFATRTFDPDAQSGLEAGTYGLTLAVGGESEDIRIAVNQGDTWRTVLDSIARSVNGSSTLATAEVLQTTRQVYLDTDNPTYAEAEGVALRITALASSKDQTLHVSGGEHLGEGIFTLDSLVNDTLAVAKDQYDALVNGDKVSLSVSSSGSLPAPLDADTDYYVYKYGVGTTTVDHVTSPTYLIQLSTSQEGAEQGTGIVNLTGAGSGTFSLGVDELRAATGLNATAQPASTVLVDYGDGEEDALPLDVTVAMDELENGLSDVAMAYNSLHRTLEMNVRLLEAGFADRFDTPLNMNIKGLKWLGLNKLANGELYLGADQLYTALGQDPARAEGLLTSAKGVITLWSAEVRQVLQAGLESFLAEKNPNSLLASGPTTENDLEKTSRVVDVLDSHSILDLNESSLDSTSRFFDLKG